MESTFPKLIEVVSVTETKEGNGAYLMKVRIQYDEGEEPELSDYFSTPEGAYGINPSLRKWLSDNPNVVPTPYVPPPQPTIDEIRSAMPNLTRRQFWIAAASIDVTKESLLASVEANTTMTPTDKLYVKIEVEEATYYTRTNPYVILLSDLMGVTQEELDSLWTWAVDL